MGWNEDYREALRYFHSQMAEAKRETVITCIKEMGMGTRKEVMEELGIKSEQSLGRIIVRTPQIRELYMTVRGGAKKWDGDKIVGGDGIKLGELGVIAIRWLFVEVNEAMYYKFHNDILKKKKLDRLHKRSLTFQLH